MAKLFLWGVCFMILLAGCGTHKETSFEATSGVQQPVHEELTTIPQLDLSPTKIMEYQKDGTTTNISLDAGFKNNPVPLDNYIVGWTEDKGTIQKFGYNITLPNDLTGEAIAANLQNISFTIQSAYPLEPHGVGVRYATKTVQESPTSSFQEYVTLDFSDILPFLQYEITLDPQEMERKYGKDAPLTANISVPYFVNVKGNEATITFDLSNMKLSKGQHLFLDPTISINNVQNYTSTKNNVTCDTYPSCHVTINNSDIVYYLPFDVNASSNIHFDYSPSRNNATATNSPIWNASTGLIGGTVIFDGTNDYLTTPDANSLDISNGTMAAWVRRSSTGTWDGIIAKGSSNSGSAHNYGMEISDGNRVECIWGIGGTYAFISPATTINANTWYHIVCTWDTSDSDMYINTVNTDGDPITTSNTNTAALLVGEFGGNSDPFHGRIDEVMLLNRTLSATEVSALYNSQLARYSKPATQLFSNIDISQDGTLNKVNVSTNTTLNNGSTMQARLQEYNSGGTNTANTSWQSISTGEQTITFDISTSTYNVTLELNYTTNNLFYSPVIHNLISLTSYSTGGGGGGTCALITTGGVDYWPCGCNINTTLNGASRMLVINGTGTTRINSSTNHTDKKSIGYSTSQQCLVIQQGGAI